MAAASDLGIVTSRNVLGYLPAEKRRGHHIILEPYYQAR